MKKTIFRYGFYGLGAGAILFGCGLLFGDSLGYRVQELIGYGSIVLSLMFVFFGIKYYRDHVRKGEISFAKAILIGILISALVGAGVGLADFLYTTVIHPDFAENYLINTLETYETMYSGSELEAKKAELTEQMEAYGGSGFMAFLMFFTVIIIGVIISLISAFVLHRKPHPL